MTPLHRIVVPVDRSASSLRALWPARVIADLVGADLVAASVVAKLVDRDPLVADLRGRIRDAGVDVTETVVTVDGYTVAQGLEEVASGPGVLVVVATAGHPRTLAFTGSVAEELVHGRLGQPTLLVGPHVDVASYELAGPMVLCRDEDRPSPEAEEVADRLARQLVMEQVVLSVRPPLGQEVAVERDRPSGVVTRSGQDPASAIVAYADEVGASIIAAGTHRRDGLSRLAFGSVAIRTVTDAHCPVLAVPEPA